MKDIRDLMTWCFNCKRSFDGGSAWRLSQFHCDRCKVRVCDDCVYREEWPGAWLCRTCNARREREEQATREDAKP